MSKHPPRSGFAATLLAGALALLPLVLTIAALTWAARLLISFIGPDSVVGGVLARLGLTLVDSPGLAYAFGAGLVLLGCYGMGLLMRSGAGLRIRTALGRAIGGIPVFGQVYGFAAQFVDMLNRDGSTDLQAMSPVWVRMGAGDGGVVLALLPNAAPVLVGGVEKIGVLVPMAPVPFGGGLFFVPKEWVEPADLSIEELTSIYVSMGLSAPTITNPNAVPAGPANAPAR